MIRGGLLAGSAALLLAGSGCAQERDSAPAALPPLGPVVTAAAGTGAPITDADRLRGLLLSPADLPRDFTPLPDNRPDATVTGASPTKPAECARVLTPLVAQRPGAQASAAVQYAGPDFSGIDIDAASYSDAALPSAFADVQALLRRCTSYSDTGDLEIGYRIGGLPKIDAGDAAAAFQLRTDSEGLSLYSAVAIVQVGNTLAQVSVTAQQPVDPGLLGDLTVAQVRRLRT